MPTVACMSSLHIDSVINPTLLEVVRSQFLTNHVNITTNDMLVNKRTCPVHGTSEVKYYFSFQDGESPLHEAVKTQTMDVIEALVDLGMKPNNKNTKV